MEPLSVITALANLGGVGFFAWIVYSELKMFRLAFAKFSDKVIYVKVARAETQDGDE